MLELNYVSCKKAKIIVLSFNYLSSAVEGSGTSFRKLKGSTGATGNWTFTIPSNNMPFQIIVKNADGTFDSATTSTLNSAIVKN